MAWVLHVSTLLLTLISTEYYRPYLRAFKKVVSSDMSKNSQMYIDSQRQLSARVNLKRKIYLLKTKYLY